MAERRRAQVEDRRRCRRRGKSASVSTGAFGGRTKHKGGCTRRSSTWSSRSTAMLVPVLGGPMAGGAPMPPMAPPMPPHPPMMPPSRCWWSASWWARHGAAGWCRCSNAAQARRPYRQVGWWRDAVPTPASRPRWTRLKRFYGMPPMGAPCKRSRLSRSARGGIVANSRLSSRLSRPSPEAVDSVASASMMGQQQAQGGGPGMGGQQWQRPGGGMPGMGMAGGMGMQHGPGTPG